MAQSQIDLERADDLEELASLYKQAGRQEDYLRVLEEMSRMQDELEASLSQQQAAQSQQSEGKMKGTPEQPGLMPGIEGIPMEFMQAVNRAVVEGADFFTAPVKPIVDLISAISGSEFKMPTIKQGLKEGYGVDVEPRYMEPGMSRDIVSSAGEFAAPGVAAGSALRKAASKLPAVAPGGESVTRHMLREAGKTTAAQDVAVGTLAGAGKEIGEEIGGPAGGIVGSIVAPMAPAATMAAARSVSPSNLMAKYINKQAAKSAETPYAERGRQLVDETGVELTPAAQTGSKTLTFAENAARQSSLTSDDAFAVDKKIANQAVEYIGNILSKMSPEGSSAGVVGERVRGTIKNAVSKILEQRNVQAAREYGQIRELAGEKPVITFKSATDEAKKIISEYEGVAGADAAKVVKQAKTLLKKLGRTTKPKPPPGTLGANALPAKGDPGGELLPIDINTALKNRSYYSNASKGVGRLFDDVSPTLDRQIAARISKAMEQDFDNAAEAAGGDIGAMLKQANTNYRAHMQSVEYIENSVLGRMMGEDFADALYGGQLNKIAPEAIVDKMVKLNPSEMKTAVTILNRYSPETVQQVRRHYVERALDNAAMAAPSKGQDTLAIDPNKFVSSLVKNPKDLKRMEALFTKKELDEMDKAFEIMRRWGDTFGKNFSGTAPMKEFLDVMGDVSVKGVARFVLKRDAMKKIVKSMADPTARKEIIETAKMPKSKAAKQLGVYIENIMEQSERENQESDAAMR